MEEKLKKGQKNCEKNISRKKAENIKMWVRDIQGQCK